MGKSKTNSQNYKVTQRWLQNLYTKEKEKWVEIPFSEFLEKLIEWAQSTLKQLIGNENDNEEINNEEINKS